MKIESKEKDWTVPDKDGTIHIPDELDGLFNKLGMQLRFHTLSDKNEIQTVADMIWIAEQFFKKKYGQQEDITLPEGWISPKHELPGNGEKVIVLTDSGREAFSVFERFFGNDIWETDEDAGEDETVIGWKKIVQDFGKQTDLFSV
jgi:hypothetical protein